MTKRYRWSDFEDSLFDHSEERAQALLKHGFVTAPIVELWNTAEFEIFKQISPDTPLYSLNPPFLFTARK